MDINDIMMISIYNYIDDKKLEYNEMYDKLINDIALYIENNLMIYDLDINYDLTKQFLMHFLSIELDLEKFIGIEHQIINYNIYDDILTQEEKERNIINSCEIINVYQGFNQEKIILDILNKVDLKKKIKSR
jgi:hypothetical protein